MPHEKNKPATEEEEEVTETEELAKCEEQEPCGGSRIEVAREKNGEGEWEYSWMLYAKNGKMIATNPAVFSRLNDLKEALESVKQNIKDADTIRLY